MLKDYYDMLKNDPDYAERAKRISELSKDISEVISVCDLSPLSRKGEARIAWHPPCTLQHGQKITGIVENILEDCGYVLTSVPDQHLCCGSAGTYSILQKDLSQTLLSDKLRKLQSDKPDVIVTGNIGCLMHLRSKSSNPVKHWLEMLDME